MLSVVIPSLLFSFLAVPVFANHSININTADKAALILLDGIGDVKAQAIIDYRGTNGPFGKIEDIMNVSGIGDATFNKIKDHIMVQGGNSSVTPPASGAATPPAVSPSNLTPPPTPAPNDFVIDGGSDRTIAVGADVQFSARANNDKGVLDNVSFVWNFGDGSTGNGPATVHKFEYPGRYSVVVSGYKDDVNATDRFTVIAEMAQLLMRVLPDGGVEIENLAKNDADLSRWIIQSAGHRFSLPDNSMIPSGQTMHISPNTLHFYAGDMTELDYPSGALAFRAGEYVPETSSSAASAVSEPEPVSISPPVRATDQGSSKKFSQQSTAIYEEKTDERSETIQEQKPLAASSSVAAAAAAGALKWWLGALAIAVFAGGSTFAARRFGRKEWKIVEDTPESA